MVISNADIYTPDQIIKGGTVRLAGDRIAAVEPGEATHGEESLDGRDLLLIPGLIDMQCNGLCGFDVLDGTAEALGGLAGALPRYGCTAVLPTLVSAPNEILLKGLAAIADAAQGPERGAVVLGAHLEGPWLSCDHHGAHNTAYIHPFDPEEWTALHAAARGTVRLVTLAPEIQGNMAAIPALLAAGAIVSLGHSGASYDQTVAANSAGARMATHIFNAMGPLHHRAPGLVGAALDLLELTPSVIPDGHHLHPATLRLVAHARSAPGLVVITDSVPIAGLPSGVYPWQGREVHWDGETVHLADGTLAGSGLTPIEALRRYVSLTGLDLYDALPAMTSIPATLLGQEDERGAIVPGARADLVLLTRDLRVHTTLVGGRILYHLPA